MKKTFFTLARIGVLTIALAVCYMFATFAVGLGENARPSGGTQPGVQAAAQPAPADAGLVLQRMLLYSAAVACVVSLLVLRSRAHGWKLAGALALGIYGIPTFLFQIESLVYLRQRMPPGLIPKLFLMGAIVAAAYSPVAVLVLGKMRRPAREGPARPPVAAGRWVVPLLVIGFAYLVLYMGFGHFVAWRNPDLRAYYGGSDPGSFLAQMSVIWATRPWMFPFQVARGVLWALFLLPMIRLLRRSSAESAIAMALFSGVWSLILLVPNPVMPRSVAYTHLWETLGSDLIFGAIVGWWLARISHGEATELPAAAPQ